MILIADGGSTKCDWVLLDSSGEVILKTRTKGLNPAVFPKEELLKRIESNTKLASIYKKASVVDFFGAGCSTRTPISLLNDVLSQLFVSAKISIKEDMLAAVFAVTTEPGIVCILGTGSNSCYFDRNEIHSNIPSLGYILMDEASGNYFGKRLIRDYYYKKMPSELAIKFEKQFNLDADIIKTNIYKKPNPNAYLASFAEFIFNTQDVDAYFYNLLQNGISKFIKNHVLCYENANEVPIHFVGSIAYYSETLIKECLNNHGLKFGSIVQKPIDGLIAYYKTNKL